jgi:hypothetical protein
MMTRPLTHQDIRNWLTHFARAIELDQVRVDGLPREKFHPAYDDNMWRNWRRDHLDYIDQLLRTVDEIPARQLQELTELAITYEPSVVKQAVFVLVAQVANGCGYAPEDFETAPQFFGCLIEEVGFAHKPLNNVSSAHKPLNSDARARMMKWLDFTDPLHISEDPECGYELPTT